MGRPVILVTAGFPAYGDYMAQCYARPLEEAGALPLHLPYLADFADAVALADGILMGFGGDIHPARYGGDAAHPTLTNVSEARDAFEFGLAGAALASGKPVLGICRGMQVINVARGGSMHADAGDHPGGDWDRWALVRESVLTGSEHPGHPDHELRVVAGSRLEAAGALPLHLPYLEAFEDAVALADGILMGFGGDIHPGRYGGDAAHPTLTNVSAARDAFEFALVRAALASGKPVLGICRGMQVINVARGGTMHADAGEHPGGDWDRWALVRESVLTGSEHPGHPDHELRVTPGSRLDAALGPGPHRVNSWHHQAIDRLGDGVSATGRAEDGVVEAIEVEGDAWVLGVQWELQESWKEDERQAAIFRAFVSATARPAARAAAA